MEIQIGSLYIVKNLIGEIMHDFVPTKFDEGSQKYTGFSIGHDGTRYSHEIEGCYLHGPCTETTTRYPKQYPEKVNQPVRYAPDEDGLWRKQ